MPPLTPEQLGQASARLDGLTQRLEKTILDDICRRIAKAGTVTDTAEWQILRLKEMGEANDVIEKAVSDYTKLSAEEVRQLFHEAAQVSDDFYAEMYTQSGKPFVPVEEDTYMQQLITATVDQTNNELANLTRSMGFAVRQADGSTAFQPAAKAYQSALDLAQMQVATGTFDYTTAIRNSVKALTGGGLYFVEYESGHRNRADVAARRAVLTGLSQMTGQVSKHNAEELETDIVEVTAHAGARPSHAEWQGRRYSLSGKSKEYPSLEEATGYGTGDGLKGWNCRHDFYPVIPGISPPAYTEEQLANIDPPPVEYNGKMLTYYECTQKQRVMETAMRKTKREIIAAQASGDDDMFTAKSIRLRRQKEEYANFSKSAGMLTQNERAQVYGFDRSVAAKASWAVRKASENILSSGAKPLTTSNHNAKIESVNVGSKLFSEQNRTKMLQHERIISGNKHETAIVYKSNGEILFQKKGDKDSVKFTREQIKSMDGKILTHNHPNGSIFSPQDINIMRRGNLFEIRACNNNGAYVIRRSEKWSYKLTSLDKIKQAYNDCMAEIENKYADIAAREGQSILLYFDRIDYEGMNLFCQRYKLDLSWEDKI